MGFEQVLHGRQPAAMRATDCLGGVRLVLLGVLFWAGCLMALALAYGPATAAAAPGTAYVVNSMSKSVTPIEVATNKPGSEVKVGEEAFAIAITPDGRTAYVVNAESNSVTPIDLTTNTAGAEIKVGNTPLGVAITPDGRTAYVTDSGSASVTPIEVATNKAGPEIKVGKDPVGIAITPDGKSAYVANSKSESVSLIDLATNKAGPEITVGKTPFGVAITPDGRSAYVTNLDGHSVTPIEVATNKTGAEIQVGEGPDALAITRAAVPTAVTEAATAISPSAATLNALVTPDGALISACNFEYGTSTSYGASASCIPAPGFGPSPVAVSAAITGLIADTEYHFRISATNEVGTALGSDRTFRALALQATPVPPTISAVSITHRRFRVGKHATAISSKKNMTPTGASFHFTLSAAAKLQIRITRTASGLRRGHSCLAPSTKLERAHATLCTRTVTVGTLTRASERQGADSVAFTGRVGRRALSPRGYKATLTASDTAGRSKPVTLSFTIVR